MLRITFILFFGKLLRFKMNSLPLLIFWNALTKSINILCAPLFSFRPFIIICFKEYILFKLYKPFLKPHRSSNNAASSMGLTRWDTIFQQIVHALFNKLIPRCFSQTSWSRLLHTFGMITGFQLTGILNFLQTLFIDAKHLRLNELYLNKSLFSPSLPASFLLLILCNALINFSNSIMLLSWLSSVFLYSTSYSDIHSFV